MPLTAERERLVRDAHDELRALARLDLRLGWELTPTPTLLDEDPTRYELEGTGFVLIEVPFQGPHDVLVALAEHVEAAGLRPLIAHPERTASVLAEPSLAERLAARWPLQVNASSLLGHHGARPQELGWRLLEDGHARIVASDGHRLGRPARLDEAYAAVRERLGDGARALFDGSAIGLATARPTPSPAASRGA